ncbi:flagellar motor switch protein FliG [Thalassobium sp. R2A62]|jgi:flagellar motor switch protein FliG|uniref:flagellar motor switch protein FliG n=1 Tax=Thalassobium sp. R2A62 TaxID=633131 RepID=UPI0001B1CCFE|nr:FliG C-terminal domain-containing protein [Thalassobium sp. R2A62]EET47463.1 flagellar motor switch protein FliG [Thalassobium sp. R2A62]MDG1338384.1 FliG C-terminal domain-containing protein [Paracoccaceae bacterium]
MNAQTPTVSDPQSRLPNLSHRHKAAIVVKLLISEGFPLALDRLSEDEQIALTHAIGEMNRIDQTTLHEVIKEFATELNALALTFSGGVDGALNLLEGKIAPQAAERIRREASVGKTLDPWDHIRRVDPNRLLPLLEDESVEVGAVILSKLPIKSAAELLGQLPGERARRITFAVSQTGMVTPEAVARIGASVIEELDEAPTLAFDTPPVDRIGAILNSSPASTREDVLDGLLETDPEFAEDVRRTIFTFANLPTRVDPKDVPKITRDVDAAILVTALAAALSDDGADTPAAEFLLENISQRMAGQLRDEIGERGKVKKTEGEAAMTAVIDALRTLEETGEITLISPDEDDEDG